jgi:hypothetical protein
MQSWLAPVIALVFWGLMRAGVYSRGWLYVFMFSLHGMCGLRAFVSTVFQHLATLKDITVMVNAKDGTDEDKLRRRSFLNREYFRAVLILFTGFSTFVLCSASMILLGSLFNSRQMAIHAVVMYLPIEIITGSNNFFIHSNLNKKRKETEMDSKKKTPTTTRGIKVVPEGMSTPGSYTIAEQEQWQCNVMTFSPDESNGLTLSVVEQSSVVTLS